MTKTIDFYTLPSSMEPLFPESASGELEKLSIELVKKSGTLSGTMNPITRKAVADFLRPMNSYYSNLIEGHDTHPIDIENALKQDYSKNKTKRDLQYEAKAHINVHEKIHSDIKTEEHDIIPCTTSFLTHLHKEFYKHLPEDFKKTMSKEGELKNVIPGEIRTTEVEVGKHIAPRHDSLDRFMTRFESFYNPESTENKLLTKRIISIAASHHRLTWIHPFIDGNGRVVRLYSDACFMYEDLDSSGLWSISRGLARTNSEYKTHLANADLQRQGDHDGRGNLSNKMLVEFCKYFLAVAIDQIEYMTKIIDINDMVTRLEKFADLMDIKGILKPLAKHILVDVFLKGKISKSDAMRITRTSDKTLKSITDKMIELDLLSQKREGRSMMYYVKYPIKFSPMLFPGLYPSDKEIDMLKYIA